MPDKEIFISVGQLMEPEGNRSVSQRDGGLLLLTRLMSGGFSMGDFPGQGLEILLAVQEGFSAPAAA